MGLSSNILWHQTKTDSLKQILRTRSFRFSYSKEVIPGINVKIAFPMISFCNLPFAEFADYGNKYGGYSIGMSREWGIKNHFNPVLYCESTSNLIRNFAYVINSLKSVVDDRDKIFDVLECLAYIKPVEDTLEVGNKKYSNYRFMDEREVRLVPNLKVLDENNIPPILDVEEYSEYKLKHNNKSLISNYISFDWSDLKYLIVQNPANIKEYQQLLHKLGCDNDNINIFSQQQVNEDFIGIGHNKLSPPSLLENLDLGKLNKLMDFLIKRPSVDSQNIVQKIK